MYKERGGKKKKKKKKKESRQGMLMICSWKGTGRRAEATLRSREAASEAPPGAAPGARSAPRAAEGSRGAAARPEKRSGRCRGGGGGGGSAAGGRSAEKAPQGGPCAQVT